MMDPTHDEILCGRLRLWQPAHGPRVSIDTVLLAAWVRTRARKPSFVELGSAAGAVSLMLALRFPPPFHVTGVELQPGLVKLAQLNRSENGLEDRTSFIHGDLRNPSLLPAESFDGLAVNPPYEAPSRGRVSPLASRAMARHGEDPARDLCCSIDDVASAAARLLKGRGRLFAIFRTDRMVSFLTSMMARGLAPKRLRMVHPRPGEPSKLFLVECMKGGGEGLAMEPPLAVLGGDGQYAPELRRAYELEGL